MANKYPFELNYHHTGIFVSDMEVSKKWYQEILGFEPVYENIFELPGQAPTKMCWLKHGCHYIELYEYEQKQEPFTLKDYLGKLGTKHVCYWIEDDKFDDFITYLEEKEVAFTWGVSRGYWTEQQTHRPNGCRVTYFNDPDGIPIEVHESFTPGEYDL